MKIEECTICGKEAEFTCETCGEYTCEDCLTPFTLQNQIDYCLCSCCHNGNERDRADEYQRREEEEKQLLKIKNEKAHKRWLWYHSAEQIEKRRQKRIALLKLRQERAAKRAQEMGRILADIFKHM